MFTIKLYTNSGFRQRIIEAESFTVMRTSRGSSNTPTQQWAEITAHLKGDDGIRFDIGPSPSEPSGGVWEKAIIENSAGRTTEIIGQDQPYFGEVKAAY